MAEISPDLSDKSRCISVHWSLPVQCVLPRTHRENWHEAWHPKSGNRIRYRRSMGVFRTEELLSDEWTALAIPPPSETVAELEAKVRQLTEDRDRARDAAVALEQEIARVRALHAKRDVFEVNPDGTFGQWLSSGCEACSDPDLIADLEAGELTEDLAPWPCATIRAMDGGEAP